jgi:hypothetical protein
MSGTPSRVAVQLGAHTVRIAGATADGEPRLVAEWVGGGDVGELLIESVGRTVDELVLVHPPDWSHHQVQAGGRELGGFAGRLRALAVPVAAAAARPCVVLDIGRRGTEITGLAEDGTVRLRSTVLIGGDHLDGVFAEWLRTVRAAGAAVPGGPAPLHGGPAAVPGGSASEPELLQLRAVANRIRERLSLHPVAEVWLPGAHRALRVSGVDLRRELADPLHAVVEALAGIRARAGPMPVLLIGGVARTPLLAELVDEAAWPMWSSRRCPRPQRCSVRFADPRRPPVTVMPPYAGGVRRQPADPQRPPHSQPAVERAPEPAAERAPESDAESAAKPESEPGR